LGFSVKPFLKRVVITLDRVWGEDLQTQTLPEVFDQAFSQKSALLIQLSIFIIN
jgi:hypothetical protein